MNTDIKNLENYDPSTIPDEELIYDWAIVIAWWSRILKGLKLSHSKEQVINVASLIWKEMQKRNIETNKEELSEAGLDLLSIVQEGKIIDELAPVNPSGNTVGEVIKLRDVLPYFKSFYTKKPFIYLVGGICNHPEAGTKGDIDILIDKANNPDEDMALEFRIYRMFPQELWPRLHFLYDQEHRGPFTNHIPLFDQLIERTSHSEVVLMSARDALSPDKKKEAQASEASDSVEPFRFFLQPKPTHGRMKGEIYSPESLSKILLTLEPWPEEIRKGVYVEPKYDGIRVQIHRVDDRIVIWTEEGTDITNLIPQLREAFLEINADFVCGAELELWIDGQHQNRADTTATIMDRDLENPAKDDLRATVYDCQWFNGVDIHNQPFSQRIASINAIKNRPKIAPAIRSLERGMQNILDAVKKFAGQPGSEGAMLKIPSAPYELDGKTSLWLKYKNEFSMVAQVLRRNKVADSTSVWNYDMGIRRRDGSIAYVGRTYNTAIEADEGDHLRVVFVELNLYKDPDTNETWFNWWAPRVVEKTSDPLTTMQEARKIVMQTSGQVSVKKEPSIDSDFSDEDIFMKLPPETKSLKGIVHAHIRGKSVHLDWRTQLSDELLVGWTLFVPKGLSKVPESMKEATDLFEKEIMPVITKKLETKTMNFNARKKAPEPIEWLSFEGEVKPGEVGATKFEPGFFIIIDRFKVEYGAQKPYFHEYFTSGAKHFNGRIVFRLLENKDEWKKTPTGLFTWMMNRVEPPPYVLSKRAVKIGWMPPDGFSALPKEERDKIPQAFQYWRFTGKKAKEVRDAYVLMEDSMDDEEKYKLQLQSWKGQTVIRAGPSRKEYHLLLKLGKDVLDFISPTDPRSSVAATLVNGKSRWDLEEGNIDPQTKFNPTKNTPSYLEILEEGTVTWLINEPSIKKFILNTGEEKRTHIATKETGSKFWIITPTEASP